MEKMYMAFVHIRLIKIKFCSTKWAICGKKATKIKETTMKTVQFIAKKLVKTAHWSWRLVSNYLSYELKTNAKSRGSGE